VTRLVLIIFFLEAGLVLALAPRSANWDRNYFAETVPAVRALISNNFVRGAVTGLGLVNICAAVMDLLGLFTSRRNAEALSIMSSPAAKE
jgi:hypothetical protein